MRILVVLSRVPWPLEKGDKLRAYHLIKELSKQHEIILFCLSDRTVHPEAERKLKEFCSEVLIHRLSRAGLIFRLLTTPLNKRPFQVNYFLSAKAIRAFNRCIEQHIPQHIYCQLVRTAHFALPYTTLPKTMDYMDAMSTGMSRMAGAAKWPLNLVMHWEMKRLKRYETEIYPHFDRHTIISAQDEASMELPGRLSVIPNGIDSRFFEAHNTEKTRDIMFSGNLSYRPNVESARYLVKEIMPLVWEKHPEIRVTLAGASPSAQVKSLASDKVEITGWVDDIRDVYRSVRIYVAPMLINTGMQNKLLEAMATPLPCVTTTLANNAIGAKPGEEVLLGDSPREIANQIIRLLENQTFSETLKANGRAFVEKSYKWSEEASRLESIFTH